LIVNNRHLACSAAIAVVPTCFGENIMPLRRSTQYVIGLSCISLLLFPSLARCQSDELLSRVAELADGRGDASSALQELLHVAPGNVRLGAGTYRLEKTIEIDLARTGYFSLEASPACKLVMAAAGPALRIRGSHFKSADPGGFSEQV